MSDFVKAPPPLKRSRFAFLKTKRAIAVLTALVIVSVVLVVLGATNELTPHSVSHDSSTTDSIGSNASDGNSASNSGGAVGNTGGDNSDTITGGSNNSTNSNTDGDTKGDTKGDDTDSKDDDKDDKGDSKGNTKGGSEEDGKDDDSSSGGDPTIKPGTWKPTNSSSIASGTPLRIMCLGASIVRGEVSSDSNGFRKTLRADLAALGAPVNMVGSQRYGTMPDNDFEAYGGNRVKQIHEHAKGVVPAQRPNVFVINVGTNNVLQRRDTDAAGAHMEAFIDYLLATSPRSTVVLSTLLTNTVPNREPLILDINAQFRALFARKYEKKAVVLAELHPSAGLPGRPETGDISSDGSHPTDRGYEIMGHLLAEAIQYADAKGYLRWPENGLAYDGEIGRLDDEEAPSPPEETPAASGNDASTTDAAAATT
ncbi:putative GDSL-like lipase acylhydrolase [Rosellinia necatrix]|uniref:Putative GDSL-like lipase acylhydrolase n=1 Tax=Rosellinia necatrix TaxID=77044 RepID=A0A1W2TJ04_ROSNE|nr:putative GDSL-like lipase acylhydrolase [Rosellinia necatrix]